MSLLTNDNSLMLWQDTIKQAVGRCDIELQRDLEAYLIQLLIRYTNQPDIAKQVFAVRFLEGRQLFQSHNMRAIGDQCLLLTGLFPRLAEKRLVKVSYFVHIGQEAYISLSGTTNDLFDLLAHQFVILMDVLQSIRPHHDLMPLEAYELWQDTGSLRAYQILRSYSPHR